MMQQSDKDIFNMLVDLSNRYTLITGFGFVKLTDDGWHLDKVVDDDLWPLVGSIGNSDLIIDALQEIECEDQLKEGYYDFKALLTYDSGQYDRANNLWEIRPYYMVDHIEFSYTCSVEEYKAATPEATPQFMRDEDNEGLPF